MSNGSELKSAGARALRAAGYKPCPRYWLTQEQMDLLEYMARQNAAEVSRIRAAAAREKPAAVLTKEQQINLAWSNRR